MSTGRLGPKLRGWRRVAAALRGEKGGPPQPWRRGLGGPGARLLAGGGRRASRSESTQRWATRAWAPGQRGCVQTRVRNHEYVRQLRQLHVTRYVCTGIHERAHQLQHGLHGTYACG